MVQKYGLKRAKTSVIPPGGRPLVDASVLQHRRKPFKIVYAGLVAYRENVDLFVRSMPSVIKKDSEATFYITRKGEEVTRIQKLANDLRVTPEFFWFKNYDDVNHFLSSCHLGVLTSSRDKARQMGTPAKLFTYMSVGLPIIANDIGGWTEMIQKEKIGVLSSGNAIEFGETLSNLLASPGLEEYACNCLKLVRVKYNWDNSAKSLLMNYDDLLGKARPGMFEFYVSTQSQLINSYAR